MLHYFYLIYHYFNKFREDNNVIQMQIAFGYHVSNHNVKEQFLYLKCCTFTQSCSEMPFSEEKKLDRVLFLLSFRNICSLSVYNSSPCIYGLRIITKLKVNTTIDKTLWLKKIQIGTTHTYWTNLIAFDTIYLLIEFKATAKWTQILCSISFFIKPKLY